MKVVINRCFGGFGLSRDALLRLARTPCEHVVRHVPREYFGGKDGWEKEFAEYQSRSPDSMFALVMDGDRILTDEHRYGDRNCSHLVFVVEAMGDAANGQCAELEVVSIPDGVEFGIEEYDGVESIHENHRRWP